jgi:hypothetical protein
MEDDSGAVTSRGLSMSSLEPEGATTFAPLGPAFPADCRFSFFAFACKIRTQRKYTDSKIRKYNQNT